MLTNRQIDHMIQQYGADILAHEHTDMMKHAYQHGNVTTYDHVLNVAALSLRIVDRLHLWRYINVRVLVRAALLHDYFLYDWHDADDGSHRLHGFRHPATAERNARRDFAIDERTASSIRTHMFPLTPRPPRYIEGWIVDIADTISATRETLSPSRWKKRTRR